MTIKSKTLAKARQAAENRIDARIETVYRAVLPGHQINILNIPALFAEGRKAIAGGADDLKLGAALVEAAAHLEAAHG